MTALLKQLHIWVGLFNFTILIVFAAAGLHAVMIPAPAERPEKKTEVREVPYEAPADFTDKQVADHLFDALSLPLVGRIPEWAIARNAENVLVLSFHSSNGVHRVTVVEEKKIARIERTESTLGEFLNIMHATPLWETSRDPRMLLWSLYVDLSIFSLLFMVVTGIWLWLTSRPRLWWAQASFGIGTVLFIVLYVVTR